MGIVRFTLAEIVRAIKGVQNAGPDGAMQVIAKGHEHAIEDEEDWREGSPL